jgi:nicotinamide-nucleotide adenylyltransferase
MFTTGHNSWSFSPDDIHRFRVIQRLLDKLDPEAQPQACIVPGAPEPVGIIIVFPGSFNPPTTAHLAMLKQAQQFEQLHEAGKVYAAVSKHTTDKEHVERPLLVDRLALLEVVLQRHTPGVGIMLFNRGLYVEQAEGMRAAFPAVTRLLFLVGFDKIVQIFDPHYYTDRDTALGELFALAEILVAPRKDAGEDALRALLDKPENRQFARFVHLLPLDASYRQVSSTHIRQDFAGHQQDVPPEVERFIEETGAYAPPVRSPDGTQRDVYGERIAAINDLLGGDGM